MYKPHAAAGSGVCLCFELVFAPFLHIIGWLLINQSGALIICLLLWAGVRPFPTDTPPNPMCKFCHFEAFSEGFWGT